MEIRKSNESDKFLTDDYKRIVIETEGEEPEIIAVITDNEIVLSEGFQARLTPRYR